MDTFIIGRLSLWFRCLTPIVKEEIGHSEDYCKRPPEKDCNQEIPNCNYRKLIFKSTYLRIK